VHTQKHLQTKIEALKQRQLLYEGFQRQLEASGQGQLSLTDPESRSMKLGKGRGTEICYNVQTAVDIPSAGQDETLPELHLVGVADPTGVF
jgi:hypothetical protein